MRIAFYAPHKPIDHPVPSGDLYIGKSLYEFLSAQDHDIHPVSSFRMHNVIHTPHKWVKGIREYHSTLEKVRSFNPDIWITYHTYYKSPDIFGPIICDKLNIPYTIYQGVFSTKRRREFKNWPGYIFNKHALISAEHVFANKKIDYENLSRLILPEKLSLSHPGIRFESFNFSYKDRIQKRKQLGLDNRTIVFSVAMFRKGVKKQSLTHLIKAFERVERTSEKPVHLLLAGDGEHLNTLKELSKNLKIRNIDFLGAIPRNELYKLYSAADIFAYPGIGEALGMVYLEAQAAGLPAIAYDTRGPSEAIAHNRTGLLTPEGNIKKFSSAILNLVNDEKRRNAMACNAPERIKSKFELESNFRIVEQTLMKISQRRLKCEKPKSP